MRLLVVAALFLASSATAAGPDAERLRAAAAAAAVELSSATASTATISVETSGGPADAVGLLDQFLRSELMKTGRGVYLAGGEAEYDLKATLYSAREDLTFAAFLSRRADKRVIWTMDRRWDDGRTIAEPVPVSPSIPVAISSADVPSVVPMGGGLWIGIGGMNRVGGPSATAEFRFVPRSGLWEADFGLGAYSDAAAPIESWTFNPASAFGSNERTVEFHRYSALFFDARGAWRHRVDMKFLTVVKTALGARVTYVESKDAIEGFRRTETGQGREFTMMQPLASVGLAKEFWGGCEFELRGDWTPYKKLTGGLKAGGPSLSALFSFRYPDNWVPRIPRPDWWRGKR